MTDSAWGCIHALHQPQLFRERRSAAGLCLCIATTDLCFSALGSDPATVTSVSEPQRVLTGRSATLTCNIKAIPDATVMWYKDGILITSGSRRRISPTSDTNTQLTISSATSADNGMYQCVVSNVHGDDVGTISLQVRDHGKDPLNGLYRCVLCM